MGRASLEADLLSESGPCLHRNILLSKPSRCKCCRSFMAGVLFQNRHDSHEPLPEAERWINVNRVWWHQNLCIPFPMTDHDMQKLRIRATLPIPFVSPPRPDRSCPSTNCIARKQTHPCQPQDRSMQNCHVVGKMCRILFHFCFARDRRERETA